MGNSGSNFRTEFLNIFKSPNEKEMITRLNRFCNSHFTAQELLSAVYL